jgi:Domain of unknown function (DUF4129)
MKMENIKLENNEQRIVNRDQLSIIIEKLKNSLFTVIFIFVLGSFSTLADVKKDSIKLENFTQDSSKITVRKPLESKMTALRKLKDYQYTVQESQVIDTWWKRLLRRFFNWFGSLFTGVGNPTFWKTAAYVFIASVIVYVTLKLMGVDFSGLYRKKNNNEIPYETLGENIHTIDFADSIAEAITQKNYRLAVRLYYLKALKELTDREMIDWKINKTNRSYVYELNSPTLRPDFERITLQFEYAWYGDFPVDETQFINIKNQFLTFSDSVSVMVK